MTIREAKNTVEDLERILALYQDLHESETPMPDERILAVWEQMMNTPGHHVLFGEEDGWAVSSCVVTVIPNLTRGQRPYALVENVVTAKGCRGRGYATAILERAAELARGDGCYKLMLLTGSKEESTLRFYERAGYNREDKTGFIRWL